jgi:hypothetical protein
MKSMSVTPGRARTRRAVRSTTSRIMEALETRVLLSIAEPNNTFDTAFTPSDNIYLERSYSATDSVNSSGDADDYLKFYSLYGASNLYASLYGLSSDVDLFVYDQNHNLLGSSTHSGNTSELVNVNIPANQYFFVKVHQFGTGSSNYNLLLLNDYAGSTLGTARDVGTLWGQTNSKYYNYNEIFYNDYMDYRDNVDVYSFKMEAAGTISVRRLHTQGSGVTQLVTNLQLLNSSGSVIATGSYADGALNIDRKSVPAGQYYVRLQQSQGNGDYQMRIVSDYAGDTTGSARQLGDLTNTTREEYDMTGNFGLPTYDDDLDLYKFTVTKPTPFDINLNIETSFFTPPTFDADLFLARDSNGDGFISSGEHIRDSTNAGSDAIHFNQGSSLLPAGTYYIGVNQDGAYTSYQLDIDSDLDSPFGSSAAYKDMSDAQSFGTLTGEKSFSGGFGQSIGDFTDFYKFTLSAAGTVAANIQNINIFSRSNFTPGLQIVKDTNGNFQVDSGEVVATGSGGKLTASLAPGTYYLETVGNGQQIAYFGDIRSDYAGNTLSKARKLASISGSAPPAQNFQDYIEQNFGAGSDVDDFYTFTLPSTYKVAFSTTGVAGEDLSLALIKDANNNGNVDSGETLVTSNVLNQPNEGITRVLPAGKYYIRVHGVNGATNYTLKFAAATGSVPDGDPDDTFTEANSKPALSTSSPVNFSMNPGTDVDIIKFTAAANKTYGFDVDSRNGSSLDTFIKIFKSDGTVLASNDNGAAPGESSSKFSYLKFKFTTAGTYYIAVSLAPNTNYDPKTGAGDIAGGPLGDYKLSMTLIP